MDITPPLAAPKLLDQVRGKIRLKHYSIRTEQAYVDWIKRFVLHFDKRHPRDLGAAEVEQFLTHLAVNGKVAASTQNQAKSALLFLYKEVLAMDLPWLDKVEKARAPKRLPVVLTRDEVQAVLLIRPPISFKWRGIPYATVILSGSRIAESITN